MLRVIEQSTVTEHPLIGRRRTLALLIVALLAGPGFFVAALLNALYRDVPQRSPVPQTARMLTADPDRLDGRLLSPVSERIVPEFEQASQSDRAGTASQNPVLAYLEISGADDYDYSVRPSSPSSPATTAPGATYKTVCVRLCDGSYFPIGYSATPAQFAAHETECQSRCGSPARLYVYANGTETPLQMRSLSGRAYLELETAFRFQTTYDAQCSCRSQPWTLAARQRHQRFAQFAAEENASTPQRSSIAGWISPVELRDASATAIVPSLPVTRPAGEHEPQLVRASAASGAVVAARAATENQIAHLIAAKHRSARIAAVLQRTEILAALQLPRTSIVAARSSASNRALAYPGEPTLPGSFGILSVAQSAGQSSLAKNTEIAQLFEQSGGRKPLTATDILMRNLNPHH